MLRAPLLNFKSTSPALRLFRKTLNSRQRTVGPTEIPHHSSIAQKLLRNKLDLKMNLVAVVGTTGVGKSQLGVELALSLRRLEEQVGVVPRERAEVINSDSMQIYRGLDVITNKSTVEEMKGIEHHLMGFLNPGEEYRVGAFQNDAIKLISEIHSRKNLPIAVGGTTYYIQNLIFPNQLVADVPPLILPETPVDSFSVRLPTTSRTIDDISHFPDDLRESILSLPAALLSLFYVLPSLPLTSTPDKFPTPFPIDTLPLNLQTPETFTYACYSLLLHIDKQSASRWHWRDIRKVRRSIEVVWEGRRWSDVLEQQELKQDGSRFRTLIFWLYAEPESLIPRLDTRVDRMVQLGLLEEISHLWKQAQLAELAGTPINYSVGIYQAIGFKEFEPYLSSRPAGSDGIDQTDPKFLLGLERMKISTRQYAKKQVNWIKKKLIPAAQKLEDLDEVTIILLDATDPETWNENVRDPAVSILHSFLANGALPDPKSLSDKAMAHLSTSLEATTACVHHHCEFCTEDPAKPFLVADRQWSTHLKSKAHLRKVNPRKRVDERHLNPFATPEPAIE